tara:strand:- start:1374 stop:2087 length:714 start_codon:yes stop_codon:yes gene_type:complete
MSSDSYLPEMELPREEPVEKEGEEESAVTFDPLISIAKEGEGKIKIEISDTEEENPNFIYSDEDAAEIDEDAEDAEPVPVKPKKKLSNAEVFHTPQVMAVQDPEKPVKKKRVPTEKQLAALKKARETNRLKRIAQKKIKEAGEDPPLELLSKKKQRQKTAVTKEIRAQQNMFSEDQVAKITADAIEKYEVKRKVRKQAKLKVREADEEEKKTRQTLQRALGQPDTSDPWGMVLSGLI